MALRIEAISNIAGMEVNDDYGRVIGILVSMITNVEGYVEAIEVKVVDRGVERIPGDRVKLRDGRIVVTPEWKYEALKVIEALDRAYRRRKALDTMSSQSDIPGDVVESMKRRLLEEIKRLKFKAEDVKKVIKARISTIEDESLHVASAIANLQMLYFSGEVNERSYTNSINHLRRLKRALMDEKSEAKKILDRLEKTLEAATMPLATEAREKPQAEEKKPQAKQASPPSAPSKIGGDTLIVKIED